MNTAYQWMGIVIGFGIALMVIEYQFARKKKEGFTPIDKQRILGILWVSIVLSLLVGGLIWMAE